MRPHAFFAVIIIMAIASLFPAQTYGQANLDRDLVDKYLKDLQSPAPLPARSSTTHSIVGTTRYPAAFEAKWKASKFVFHRGVELNPLPGKALVKVGVEAVVFRDNGAKAGKGQPIWSFDEVVERYRYVAAIYARGGIQLSPLTIVEVSPPYPDLHELFNSVSPRERDHFKYFDEYVNSREDNNTLSVAEMLPRTAPIQNIHIRTFVPQGTCTAGALYHFAAEPFCWDASHPMVYRSWILADILSKDYLSGVPSGYLTEAHELGHILLDSGHVQDEKNIMGYPASMLSTRFNAEQYRRMLRSPLVKKITE